MSLLNKIGALALASSLGATDARAQSTLYDDFSSGELNPSLWQIRQDAEGQPLMDEGFVTQGVFHTQQNTLADRRTYLLPNRTFTTGDSIEYDSDLISREGNYAQMVLLTGDQYIRLGMRGTDAGFDELGMAHMKLIFQENNLAVERLTPSGSLLVDNLHLDQQNGTYSLYIGSFTGHNGSAHIDYDNFYTNVPSPSTLGLLGISGLLASRRKR